MPIQANRTSVNTVSARESSSIIGGAVLLGVGKHGRFGAKREDDWRPMWMRNARKRREPDEVPRAPVTSCFGKEKRRRGDKPRALQCYLFFFAVLRRAVPVFFAVVFFAAAVLRFAGFFLFATAMMSLLRAGWLLIHSSYIRSSLHTYRI